MKELFFGIVLIIVLGLGGFVYRYTLEHPPQTGAGACTADAKICPDGTSVGRTGADCSFAACPLPNKELQDAGIAFVIPNGYTENATAVTPGSDLLISLEKPSSDGNSPYTIAIRRLTIPVGKTADEVMLANTQYETSGQGPKAMSEFTPVTIAGRTFRMLTTGRFEAQVHSVYYLAQTNDVLRFDVRERNVTNWSDTNLSVRTLPEHAALERMLGTLQTQ